MALKFTQKNPSGSASGGTYDHNLLINRGLPDQHTIDSITSLREILLKKYEKPLSGIPKSDLSFDVATLRDIDNLRKTDIFNINESIQKILSEIVDARGDKDTLREYIDSKVSYDDWSGSGGVGDHDGNGVGYPIYQEFDPEPGQTRFELTKEYRMGTHQLEVYLNGLRMVIDKDYIESSASSVEFTFPMEDDDHVLLMVKTVISSGVHEEYIAAEDQTMFTLSNPYAIYQNIMQVYRNGVLQRKGRDYREATQFIIEFYNGLKDGDLITFHQAGSTDPIAGVILESEIGRLKMSNAQMSMIVQQLSGNETTDMLDMYVDTFLTVNAFDMDKSFEFILEDGTIKTSETTIVKDTHEEFRLGIAAGTDYHTFSDRVTIANTNGGSEGNNFRTPSSKAPAKNTYSNAVTILLPNRSIINVSSEKDTTGQVFLLVNQKHVLADRTIEESAIDYLDMVGDIKNIKYATAGDEAHVVFEHIKPDGESAIYYFSVSVDNVSVPKQVTEYDSKSSRPAIATTEDRVVIVFDSERVTSGIRNIEYVTFKEEWSGLMHVTSGTEYNSMKPDVVISSEDFYIVYEEDIPELSAINVQMVKVTANGVTTKRSITATEFDNTDPKIELGPDGIFRVAWLSQRLSDNKGVDLVFVYGDSEISGARSVFSPSSSMACDDLSIGIDYQGVTHIVYTVNERSNAINNIVYSYVTEDNIVTNYGNIISDTAYDVSTPNVTLIGDLLVVSGHTDHKLYLAEKSLANYLSSGYYTVEFDSLSEDSLWKEFNKVQYIPVGTRIDYEIRVSNDRYVWSAWESISKLITENLAGRYVQIKAHLQSEYVRTPEILSLELRCEPNMVRVQTLPRNIEKDVQNCIVIADYTGEVKFFVSRDGGETFSESILDRTTNLLGTPSTQEMVLRAEIQKGSTLKSWALIW